MSQYRPRDFFENIEPLFGRRRGGGGDGGPPVFTGFNPSPTTRRALIVIAVLVVLIAIGGPLIRFYTDLIWFRQLGYGQLFTTRIKLEWLLGGIGFLVATALIYLNTVLAVRLAGARALSRIGVRRRFFGTTAWWLTVAASAIAGVIMGLIAGGAWETVAKALSGASFGRTDPVFHNDISFYLFHLPAFRFAWGWLLGLVIVMAIYAGGVHLVRAGATNPPALATSAIVHLSLLGAAFFLLLAIHYWLATFGLLTAHNGVVFGAGWTDLHIRLPVYWLMLVLCLLLAVGLVVNMLHARVTWLVAAPVVWLVAVVLLIGIIPAIVQAVSVKPAELVQERDYIKSQIDFTNAAYGLDQVTTTDFPDTATIDPGLLASNVDTISNLRLWDYGPLQTAYQQLQSIRSYYDFHDVDIDRYTLPDGYRQVMISARELSPDRLPDPAKTWVNLHLKYTHGYGAVATPVTQVATEGQPALILRDIPPTGSLKLTQPGIYFGETTSGYVVVDSKEPESDYESQDQQTYTRWAAKNGVALKSELRRFAFALRFGDPNLVLSSEITDESQILMYRDISTRISTLAPFLQLDGDPYVVVSGGKLVWIADAYTTSNEYPYSEPEPDNPNGVNYIRNSVKVTVDAYDGSVNFYMADPNDPVVRTYANIFPGVFKPLSDMPQDLVQHLRYPLDYFTMQQRMLQTYHMHDPQDFYNRSDVWSEATEIKQQGQSQISLQPYYVVMQLPGESKAEFVLIQPFTPLNKSNMVAWLAGRADGSNYGKLLNFRFPTNRLVPGPGQAESRITQEPTIQQLFALLNQQGSTVDRGNLLVIPIGDSILFVEPVFVEATGGNAVPELKYVLVADENRVARGGTLEEALSNLTGGATPTVSTPGPTQQPSAAPTNAQLIQQAIDLYNDAQAKLKAGDLAGYQKDIDQIGAILRQIKGS